MIMVTGSVIVNVYICNFHFRSSGTHQLTVAMKTLLIEKLAPKLNMRRPGKLPDFQEVENREDTTSISTMQKNLYDEKHEVHGTPVYFNSTVDQVSYLCRVTEEEDNRGSDVDEWHYVAMIIDRLMLYIYTFLTLIGTVYYGMEIFYDKPVLDPLWATKANPMNPCPGD